MTFMMSSGDQSTEHIGTCLKYHMTSNKSVQLSWQILPIGQSKIELGAKDLDSGYQTAFHMS